MANPHKRLQTILGHLKGGEGAAVFPQPAGAALNQSAPSSRQYVYTLSSTCAGVLTDEQRDFFEKNGYLVVPGLVSKDKLQVFKDRFQSICSRDVEVPGLSIMRDVAIAKSEFRPNEKAVTKIQDFQVVDGSLCTYGDVCYCLSLHLLPV